MRRALQLTSTSKSPPSSSPQLRGKKEVVYIAEELMQIAR